MKKQNNSFCIVTKKETRNEITKYFRKNCLKLPSRYHEMRSSLKCKMIICINLSLIKHASFIMYLGKHPQTSPNNNDIS